MAAGGAFAMGPDADLAFPSRPIRFICPFVAGGVVDSLMRAMTSELAAGLGQPVVVDARPGGNGALAAQQLQAAPPDGHTWMMCTLGTMIAELMRAHDAHPADTTRPVALVAYDIAVLVTPSSLSVRSLPEFIDLARRTPGRLNYLRTGPGSLNHLVVEVLKHATGVEVEGVDYRGLPPGIVDLLAGRLQLATLSIALALPYLESGALVALAAVGPRRVPALPDLPTLAELGIGDANVASWAMATLRAGTPMPRVARIAGVFGQVLADPAVRMRLGAAGVVPAEPASQADLDALLRREAQRYEVLLGALGLQGK